MSEPGQVRDIAEAPPFHARPASHGRRVIAVIGIDGYARWPRLRNAVRDARAVEAAFVELGFETLTPSLFDGQATRAAIDDLLEALRHGLSNADHLVVYFAGHGGMSTEWAGTSEITTGYLIPVDGEKVDERLSTLFELDALLARIAKLAALHILVILDACYAGMALASSPVLHRPRGDGHHPHARRHAKTSRVVIASTLHDEQAQDGGPLPGHSLFTGCLLHALAGDMARIDLGDGKHGVHASGLGAFMRDHLERYQRGAGQTPDFGRFGNDDRGDMPIVLARDGLRVVPRGSTPRLAEGSTPVRADEPAFASHIDVPRALRAATHDDEASRASAVDEPALAEILPVSRARPIALAALVLAVLAALVGALAWRPRGPAANTEDITAELAAVIEPRDAVRVADRATHGEPPPPRVLSVIRTAPIAAVAMCPVDLFAKPKRVDILRGGVKIGVTPKHLELPCGQEITLSFHVAEHDPTIKKLVPKPGGLEVHTRLYRTKAASAP